MKSSARNGTQVNLANQRLSLYHGVCYIDNVDLANEHASCHDTPKTMLPQWLLDSEYFQEPKQPEEGLSTGVAGTNPAGWGTFGRVAQPRTTSSPSQSRCRYKPIIEPLGCHSLALQQ